MYKWIQNRATPCDIYLAKANRHLIGKLDVRNAKLNARLLDISELSVSVSQYNINRQENKYYNCLHQFMELYIPDVGWFRINEKPEESIDYTTGTYIKNFTAYSYETQLQDIDVSVFYINNGTAVSMEMFEENLDALGIPKRNIQFYVDNADEDPHSDHYYGFGTLNILEHEYFAKRGWKFGTVDTVLKGLRGRVFEIDSQDAYSLLTQDIAAAYKCIFLFNSLTKTIDVRSIDSIGKSLPVELSRRNLLNNVNITGQNDVLYTELDVMGGNEETTITYVNFGDSKIQNLDYLMGIHLSEEVAQKYAAYVEYKDTKRNEYIQTIRNFLQVQEKIDVLYNQIPIDECTTPWESYDLEELKKNLEQFKALLKALEDAHTVDGILQIDGTKDAGTYYSIKDAIIPAIEAEIAGRESGEDPPELEWELNWELYGITELKVKKKNYENQISLYEKQGYDKPWSEESSHNQETHDKHHNEYLMFKIYVTDIDARLNLLQTEADALEAELKRLREQRDYIAKDVSIENARFGFTEGELADLRALYSSAPFTDDTIEVLETDDLNTTIDLALELLESAKKELAIKSRPQLRFKTDIENPFLLPAYRAALKDFQLGDYIFLELDTSSFPNSRTSVLKTKERIIEYTVELVDLTDTEITIEFSDMVRYNGTATDNEYLLGNGGSGGIGRSGLSSASKNYVNSAASSIAAQVLENYLNGGNSLFPSGLTPYDIAQLQIALDGLINGSLSLNELKVQLAKIDHLEANSAFVKYLEAQFLVGNQADFKELKAKLADIDNLLAGNVSAELGHIIKLTADNVTIDEAVIRDVIAAQILVSDLKAGDITLTNTMRILSENGNMIMNGETLQIMGRKPDGTEFVAIQLGYDATNKPSLIICDENGSIMLDAQGLHEDAVPDGLIKNDMVANGSIGKEKLNFFAVEGDAEGNLDAAKVIIDGERLDVSYTEIRNKVNSVSEEIENAIPYVVIISTSHGRTLGKGIVESVCYAHLYREGVEVTDQFDDSHFVWMRESSDPSSDVYWNEQHSQGAKSIRITRHDILYGAQIKCCFSIDNKVVAIGG